MEEFAIIYYWFIWNEMEVNNLGQLQLDGVRIDSLVDLLKAAYTLEDYTMMTEIADRLLVVAERIHSRQKKALDSGAQYFHFEGSRHIVYYFGFSSLMKGIAFEKMEKYEEAKQCIQLYSDLSWLNDNSEEANKEISIFKMFAEANILAINVLEGKQDRIDDYIKFLSSSRIEEFLPGIMTIINSAIAHDFSVDYILEKFEKNIEDSIATCIQRGEAVYIAKFYYRCSIYNLKMKRHKLAIHNILQALEKSDRLNDVTVFKKCVALFESIRNYADESQAKRYSSLMIKIARGELENEKTIVINDTCVELI